MGTAVENEFKFTSDRRIDEDTVVDELLSYLDKKGITYSVKVKSSVDRYYDSEHLALYHNDCMLRLKNSENGKIKLTMKRPISNAKQMMSRKEIERASDGSFEDVCAFCRTEFPDLIISPEPTLMIECERTSIDLKDGSGIKLSFDHCVYRYGIDSKDFYEIEYESMDDITNTEFDNIGICGFIQFYLEFQPVVKSKYQRGIEWRNDSI